MLEAAHIRLHAGSGINDSKNGILLRADLHALFDDGLLKIEPETRTVVIDPSLAETPYWTLNGTALRSRMDSSQPSADYPVGALAGRGAVGDRNFVCPGAPIPGQIACASFTSAPTFDAVRSLRALP